jgi:hypothetical protein
LSKFSTIQSNVAAGHWNHLNLLSNCSENFFANCKKIFCII